MGVAQGNAQAVLALVRVHAPVLVKEIAVGEIKEEEVVMEAVLQDVAMEQVV